MSSDNMADMFDGIRPERDVEQRDAYLVLENDYADKLEDDLPY